MSAFDRIELVDKSNGEEIRANPHLQCPFCLDLLFEPIQCSICKKCYCKDCFDTWTGEKKCFGGKDSHTFSRNISTQDWINQYLNKFKIKCCYQGCPQKQMEYKNFKNHTRTCTYKKNGYCNETRSGEAFEWKEFQVFVAPLSGPTLTITVSLNTTYEELKQKIVEKNGGTVNDISLAYGGKPLKPKTLLEEYNVQKNTTFHQLGRLKGGKNDDSLYFKCKLEDRFL